MKSKLSPRLLLGCLAGCLLLSLLAVVLAAAAGLLQFLNPRSPAVNAGFVFANGQYIAPPYTLTVVKGDIQLNGQLLRAMPALPSAPAASAPAAPASPRTASDLVDVAASKFLAMNIQSYAGVTPAVKAQLISLIKSYPAAAEATDEGSSIHVTDQAGNTATLHLDIQPLPTSDELIAGQTEQAQEWNSLLQSNGVLLISPSTSIEVPPNNAGAFLGALVSAFEQPEAQRQSVLSKLIPAPSIVTALLAAGAPPASLRQRLPTPLPGTATPAGRAFGDAARLANAALHRPDKINGNGDAAQQTAGSRTPGSLNAYIFRTLITPGATTSIVEAARLHGYNVIEYWGGLISGPGDATVSQFLATSGVAGILFFDAHGDHKSISIEQYRTESGRDAALASYKALGIPVEAGVVDNSLLTLNYTVDINLRTVATWKGAQTIVEIASCEGFGLSQAFLAAGAREVIGSDKIVSRFDSIGFDAKFWPRMSGTMDGGTKRNVDDAFSASSPGTIFRHAGNGRTVLSPGVLSVSPAAGASLAVGVLAQVSITFDTPMSTDLDALDQLSGCGDTYLVPHAVPNGPQWSADQRTFTFAFTPRQPGDLQLRAESFFARSADNLAYLDGNQNPSGSNHVGPNGDGYFWNLKCVGGTLTPTATSDATPTYTATPTPSGTPTPTQTNTPTKTPTPTPTATATSTPSPTTAAAGLPKVAQFLALFNAALKSTFYTVSATDPNGGTLNYAWSNTNKCGEFKTGNFPSAEWHHPDIPGGCPVEAVHPGTITVVITNAAGSVTCEYRAGSASGNIAQCVNSK